MVGPSCYLLCKPLLSPWEAALPSWVQSPDLCTAQGEVGRVTGDTQEDWMPLLGCDCFLLVPLLLTFDAIGGDGSLITWVPVLP